MKEEKKTVSDTTETVFEGMISVRALLDAQKGAHNDRKIHALLYLEERKKSHIKEYAYLNHRAEEYGFPLILCAREEIEKKALGNSHGGVLALCSERTIQSLGAQDIDPHGFYVMMEGIEDPYNFGYALRSLYAAGVNGVILTSGVRQGADGIIARSSAGASERMPLFLSDSQNAVTLFQAQGYKIVSADLPNSIPVYDADLTKPLLLVVGGEKRGITRGVLDASDAIVRLDYGRAFDAALSAASAASILAFEVFRQNRE